MSSYKCDLLCLDLERAEALRELAFSESEAASAASLARALSDPTRILIAQALTAGGELCVCDLGWIIGRSHGLVSHHLRSMRSLGLVDSRREGKMIMYALTESGSTLIKELLSLQVAR